MNDILNFLSSYCIPLIIISVLSYLLGSINISIILTKQSGQTDIRKLGSGNAGFTNMLRSVGKKQAIITFIGDFLKAVIAIFVAGLIMSRATDNPEYIATAKYISGLLSVVGHMYPIYFGFRGGKGVVTGAAVILMCDYRVFLVVLAVFAVVFIISRIISLSSLSAAASYFVSSVALAVYTIVSSLEFSLTYVTTLFVVPLAIFLLVTIRHKDNIIRLKNGEEKKLTIKK